MQDKVENNLDNNLAVFTEPASVALHAFKLAKQDRNFDTVAIFGLGPIPALGIKGAAFSTVFSYFIIMIVGLWVLGVREKMLTKNIFKFDEILSL